MARATTSLPVPVSPLINHRAATLAHQLNHSAHLMHRGALAHQDFSPLRRRLGRSFHGNAQGYQFAAVSQLPRSLTLSRNLPLIAIDRNKDF